MAMDIDLNTLADAGIIRIWEGVMEQVAKDYIDTYIEYLKYGLDHVSDYRYGRRHVSVKSRLLELEDYIVGDLIAGPHATYIIHNLRDKARERINKSPNMRKEIIKRG